MRRDLNFESENRFDSISVVSGSREVMDACTVRADIKCIETVR